MRDWGVCRFRMCDWMEFPRAGVFCSFLIALRWQMDTELSLFFSLFFFFPFLFPLPFFLVFQPSHIRGLQAPALMAADGSFNFVLL